MRLPIPPPGQRNPPFYFYREFLSKSRTPPSNVAARPAKQGPAAASTVRAGRRARPDDLDPDLIPSRDAILAALKAAAARHGLKPPQVMMPLRVAVCGTRETSAIDAVLALLGRDVTLSRLAAGLAA